MAARIDNKTMLKILECIYEESSLKVQMSQVDIAAQFNVSKATIVQLFKKLEKDKLVETTGVKRSWRYRWIKDIKPTEALAIKLGAVQIKSNKIIEFSDEVLIKELKNRGYLVFKEC